MADPSTIQSTLDVIKQGSEVLGNTRSYNALDVFAIISTISVLFVATAYPVVKMIKKFTSEKDTDIIKNEAESLLYGHLVDQITETKEELDRTRKENKQLWDIIKKLETRISRLETLRTEYELLKKILNSKDEEITNKDKQLSDLHDEVNRKKETIKGLKARIVELELEIQRLESNNGGS